MLELYGYRAVAWEIDRIWYWTVSREGRSVGRGATKREASARTAARRFILSRPDAKAAHEKATAVHWNGRAFGTSEHTSASNRGDLGPSFLTSACKVDGGMSTNAPLDRARINCPKCLELLAQAGDNEGRNTP